MITGGVVSVVVTVTLNAQVPGFMAASVAVAVTLVSPIAKSVPDSWL